MKKLTQLPSSICLVSLLGALNLVAGPAQAQTIINQDKVLAGGVTTGDSAGFPLNIRSAGSYRLTSPLTVPPGQSGIVIDATGHVDIDLAGYSVAGPVVCYTQVPGSPVQCYADDGLGKHGIEVRSGSVSIRNGAVKGFGGSGVYFAPPAGGSVADLHVSGNAMHGLHLAADVTRIAQPRLVQNVQATSNKNTGVWVDGRSEQLRHIVSTSNGNGIVVRGLANIADSVITVNANCGLNITGTLVLHHSASLENRSNACGNGTLLGSKSSFLDKGTPW
jgi:hypothetical protein